MGQLPRLHTHRYVPPGGDCELQYCDTELAVDEKAGEKSLVAEEEGKWSEVALGQDKSGMVLFIFCRSPYSMHDLNNLLLKLPIDMVCAQHLEGGPEAQLYLEYEQTRMEFCGSYETSFIENDSNDHSWTIPNVIGIIEKKEVH